MKILSATALVTVGVLIGADFRTVPANPGPQISGTVRDRDGQSVGMVTVVAVRGGREIGTDESQPGSGEYSFDVGSFGPIDSIKYLRSGYSTTVVTELAGANQVIHKRMEKLNSPPKTWQTQLDSLYACERLALWLSNPRTAKDEAHKLRRLIQKKSIDIWRQVSNIAKMGATEHIRQRAERVRQMLAHADVPKTGGEEREDKDNDGERDDGDNGNERDRRGTGGEFKKEPRVAFPMVPGDEHMELARQVGEWSAKLRYEVAGMGPVTSGDHESSKMIMNGWFLESHYKGNMMGQPWKGRRIMGFDQRTKEYVEVWISEMSSEVSIHRGRKGPKGIIHLRGKSLNVNTGKMENSIFMRYPPAEDGSYKLEMHWADENGQPTRKMMEIAYARKR